jgi:hypothetical protein
MYAIVQIHFAIYTMGKAVEQTETKDTETEMEVEKKSQYQSHSIINTSPCLREHFVWQKQNCYELSSYSNVQLLCARQFEAPARPDWLQQQQQQHD